MFDQTDLHVEFELIPDNLVVEPVGKRGLAVNNLLHLLCQRSASVIHRNTVNHVIRAIRKVILRAQRHQNIIKGLLLKREANLAETLPVGTHLLQKLQRLLRCILDHLLRCLLLCRSSLFCCEMPPPLMVLPDRFLQHLLELPCRHPVRPAVLGDLSAQHFYQQLQLGCRHFYVRQFLKILRAENVLLLPILQKALHLVVFQRFLHHPGHIAVHRVGVHLAGAAHFAHHACNRHKALRKSGFLLAQFSRRLANVIGSAHPLYRFEKIRPERYLVDLPPSAALRL